MCGTLPSLRALALSAILAVASASVPSPAAAQEGLCEDLDRVFGDLVNNKLRNTKSREKEIMGWVARIKLPGMDRCHVDEDMGLNAYICDKRFADAGALEEAFKSHERVIGECFSGFRVSRDKQRTSWSAGLHGITLSRQPVRRLMIMVD